MGSFCRAFTVLLVLAPAAEAQEPDVAFRVSLATAIVAHSMDLAETMHCRGAGVCREANPLLARFESPSGFAIGKMSIASLSLWLTAKLHEDGHRRLAYTLNVAQTVGFTWLALRNARVAREARR